MSHISYCFIKVSRYKTWFCYHTRYLMPQEMLSDDSDSDEENVDTVITAMYYRLKLKCFRNLTHRQSSTSLLDYVEVSAFLLQFWIHKESFWKLHIKTLNNVNSNGSFCQQQFSVRYQLLVFRYIPGATATYAIYKKVKSRFKLSMCTVRLYFDSGTSLILTIVETEAVYWSDDAAKTKFIAERIHSKYNFPKCTGLKRWWASNSWNLSWLACFSPRQPCLEEVWPIWESLFFLSIKPVHNSRLCIGNMFHHLNICLELISYQKRMRSRVYLFCWRFDFKAWETSELLYMTLKTCTILLIELEFL